LSATRVDGVSTTEERRESPRIVAKHLVSYAHFDEQGEPDDVGMAHTLDLSEGGILLEMTHSLEEGLALEIKMVSGERIIRAKGQVVHSACLSPDRWHVGVHFTEILEGDLGTIAREIAKFRQSGG
jgi:hypothetical protein